MLISSICNTFENVYRRAPPVAVYVVISVSLYPAVIIVPFLILIGIT